MPHAARPSMANGTRDARSATAMSAWSRPTVGLLHALIAVADLASRVPVAIDGRAAWGLLALGALAVAAQRARRLRQDARIPLPPR